MSIYREMLEEWLKGLSIRCDTCLDIGGGAKPVKDRVKKWKVKNYHIWDDCVEAQALYVQDKCDNYKVLDIQSVSPSLLADNKNYYEKAFMLEVAEYLWNPIDALINIWIVMKKGGTFYSSWPFIYPLHRPIEADCLRYTDQGIYKLLRRARFVKVKIKPRVATKGLGNLLQFYKSEGMHVAGNSHHIGYLVEATKK